ncbi:GIY-YIG nuclease family protein [uncultured Clostridium sp.]|uniref:GIY-YIG nuclease family protein n=1 Tax=uncultured Clostridium sp. TaxID=59620 RepID=UPI002605DF78|nr:GIY-YIG nuclease family protein [uncultured Clostridium sp.]
MPTYYEALKNVTGVYWLTDRNTEKLYIGLATGEEGVAQRWGIYLDSKHGGNKKLIALYKEKGAEYFEQYFTYTLIEYFGLSYDPAKIIEREQYWKMCFNTIPNGYNDN